jgi:Predicted pPIWI-associating nuclease
MDSIQQTIVTEQAGNASALKDLSTPNVWARLTEQRRIAEESARRAEEQTRLFRSIPQASASLTEPMSQFEEFNRRAREQMRNASMLKGFLPPIPSKISALLAEPMRQLDEQLGRRIEELGCGIEELRRRIEEGNRRTEERISRLEEIMRRAEEQKRLFKPTPQELAKLSVQRHRFQEFKRYTEEQTRPDEEFESYFRKLGSCVNKWRGAEDALYSESRDKFRQAATSVRSLLEHVLKHLAPDDLFSEKEKKKSEKEKRKLRVERIMNDRGYPDEVIQSTWRTFDSLYGKLNGMVHSDKEYTVEEVARDLKLARVLILHISTNHVSI